jgi:hypothetical protein
MPQWDAERRVNAEPWKPPSGMIKAQCPHCGYWFAKWPRTNDPACPDCILSGRQTKRQVVERRR